MTRDPHATMFLERFNGLFSRLRRVRIWTALCQAAVGLLIGTAVAPPAWSQEAGQEKEPAELASLRKQIDESIHWFELSTAESNRVALEPKAVLRWDNNERGSQLGLTVLFIGRGRPEAVCCIYPWYGQLVHNFGSLSRGELKATQDGAIVWNPDKRGVEFNPIPDAAVPLNTPAARSRQIRSLAARFRATLVGWKGDNSDRQELRLLPHPIYRYERPAGGVTDGAVFAFVIGVDPEALLLIEATSSTNPQRWEYAFARRTSGQLEGNLDGKTVWTAERFEGIGSRRTTYWFSTQSLKSNATETPGKPDAQKPKSATNPEPKLD